MVTPDRYGTILGATFLKQHSGPILKIGAKTWTRYELGALGCPHLFAARLLDGVVQQMKITSVKQLASVTDEIALLEGVGATVLYLILAICDQANIGADSCYHENVTLQSLKTRRRNSLKKKTRRVGKARPSNATQTRTTTDANGAQGHAHL